MSDTEARLAFVAKALREVERQFRSGGRRMPMLLDIALRVSAGQDGSPLDVASLVDDAGCMTYESAAAVLQVSPSTVKRLAKHRVLPVVDIGGCPRVRAADLAAYVQSLPARPVA